MVNLAEEKDRGTMARRSGGSILPYRPGLDGLRALAVAGVFLYHANVSWMPGGFLGVDLFFVLSGYLITSLLLHEHSKHGSIRVGSFWGRRARRLFPAVVVVILFALLATLTIARDDLSRTRADALSALVYLTNWHEIIASHSYFNQFGRPSLLQHLWTLAVEEQFYLLWPLILIAGLRWLTRRGVIVLTAAMAVGSCLLMALLYTPNGDPSRVYYGTDTRAFTLLIGALLAFVWSADKQPLRRVRGHRAIVDGIGVVALLGVLAMFVRVRDFDPWLYRGGFLLMAVAGGVLVAAVSYPGTILSRALGWRPLAWIGVLSYGIYLWHWPIMQLTRPGVDVPLHGAPLILLQAAATLAAAVVSFHFIEMPVRSGRAQQRAKAWLDRHTPRERLVWVSGSAAAVAFLVGIAFGLPAPIDAATLQSTATASAQRKLPAGPPSSTVNPAGTNVQPVGAVIQQAGSGPSSTRPAGARAQYRSGELPPGPILAVGDSVMLGSAPNLEARLGHRLTVDAIVGRQAEDTIDRLAQYRAAGQLPQTVVIQIGDNGPVWFSDMQHLRKVLRGVPRVVLVNVRLARSWQDEVNHELSQYARTWPEAVIANWYANSTQAMLTDGVHPSVAARDVYARVIVDALEMDTLKEYRRTGEF